MSSPLNPEALHITTPEQALNWVVDELDDLERFRLQIEVAYRNPDTNALALRKSFRKFLLKYGAALGNVVALHRTRFLTAEQYHQMRTRADSCLVTSTVTLRDLFD